MHPILGRGIVHVQDMNLIQIMSLLLLKIPVTSYCLQNKVQCLYISRLRSWSPFGPTPFWPLTSVPLAYFSPTSCSLKYAYPTLSQGLCTHYCLCLECSLPRYLQSFSLISFRLPLIHHLFRKVFPGYHVNQQHTLPVPFPALFFSTALITKWFHYIFIYLSFIFLPY